MPYLPKDRLGDEDDGSVRYINMRWAWLDA